MINELATSVAMVWRAAWRQREALRSRVFRAVQRVALGIALAIFLLSIAYPDALLSRLAIYHEAFLPGRATSELEYRTWDYPVRNCFLAFTYDLWPYDYDIGTTGPGAQYVCCPVLSRKTIGYGCRKWFRDAVVEMGISGLILWFVMGAAVLSLPARS